MQDISWLDILGQFILPLIREANKGIFFSIAGVWLATITGWGYGIEYRFGLRVLRILNILGLSFSWS